MNDCLESKLANVTSAISRLSALNDRYTRSLADVRTSLNGGRKFGAPLEVKRAPSSAGHKISGYGSTFGNVDQYKEIVVAGAFAKSLAKHRAAGTAPLMLWQHHTDEVIGVWDKLLEDQHGLLVEGRLIAEVQKAKEAIALVDAGALSGLSIGYRVVRKQSDETTGIVRLLELDLMEISIVSMPANSAARLMPGKEYSDRQIRRVFAELRQTLDNFHI